MKTGLFERSVLEATVPLQSDRTPYVRFGDLPVVALSAGLLLIWASGALWSARREDSSRRIGGPSRRRIASAETRSDAPA